MNSRNPQSPDRPHPFEAETAGKFGAAPPAGPAGEPPFATAEHPFLPGSGHAGALDPGPEKEKPKITHGRHPRGYRRPDDLILADIDTRLRERPDLDAGRVRTAVARGIVRLEGEVPDEHHKRRIGDCVANVTGVVRVDNALAWKD